MMPLDADLMFAGLLAAHSLGYRLAITDSHARADALAHSGHGYLVYAPLALGVCLGVLLVAFVYHGAAGFRGERRRFVGMRDPVRFLDVFRGICRTLQVP